MKNFELYEKITEKYGAEHQILKALEELSELTIELSRHKSDRFNKSKLTEEIGDVQIMIDQIMCIFDIWQNDIDIFKVYKIEKLKRMV